MKTRWLMLGGAAVCALAMMAAGGAAPAVAQASAAASRGGLAVTYYPGARGVARLVPRSLRPANAAPVRAFPKGARRLPSGRFSATEAVPGGVAAGVAEATRSPLVSFNGVSSRDSEFTNYNLEFEPPDQGLCQGHGFVLEAVNSAYRIYRTSGKSVRGPFNINDLFNVGGKEFTSDPRCWFDPATGTWFATILFLNDTGTRSSLLIAVRHSPDPRGLWNEYAIDTTDEGQGAGCPCFGDQPRIGIDQTNLYVTADEFSINKPRFLGGEMWAIDKAQLVAGKPLVRFVRFDRLKIAGHVTLAPQPALSTGKPDAEYFLSQLDFNGQGDHRIGVWAMTRRGQVGKLGFPVLSSVVVTSERYANPPPAPQRGSTSTLNSGDDRMQQAEFAGGTVWGELTTAVRPAGDSKVRAGGAWFQVRPRLGAARITGASIVRQGYIDSPGQYVLYPAVQPDAAGNAAAIFTLTSPGRFPSAGYATLKAGAGNFGRPIVAAPGAGPYYRKSKRWGDYSFAVPDPTSDSAWLATEYIPPKSSQTTDGKQNWGTRVLEVPLR
ncbi:MAG TPA: hypothetical protein VKS82_02375 [Streptosporangiaceae bacterium]|jgi:hypothetical protein|nr:hypothetical protein [Streptosporangiaceae bacterium]